MARLLPAGGVRVTLVGRDDRVPEDADACWVCVRDAELTTAAGRLPDGAVALHASGAAPDDALGHRLRAGVLHPLMTFPGPEHGLPDLRGVGARIGGHPDARAVGRALCGALGLSPLELRGAPVGYHAAASLASGHLAAALLVAADTLAAATGLSADDARRALLPLARASLDAVGAHGAVALTGPVVRGDDATLDAHRAHLDGEARAVHAALTAAQRTHLARRPPR